MGCCEVEEILSKKEKNEGLVSREEKGLDKIKTFTQNFAILVGFSSESICLHVFFL